jgi:translocator protein
MPETLIARILDRSVVHRCATPDAPWLTYALTSAAVGATAIAGALAVDPDSAWYRGLAKPSWQPPRRAFGVIWTPMYASIAWAGGHALRRSSGRQRIALITSLAANLALNAVWNWMFFGLRSPRAGLAGTVLLDISNAELIQRTARTAPGLPRRWCRTRCGAGSLQS